LNSSLSAKDHRKMFRLGLIEAIPLGGGATLGRWVDGWLPAWLWLLRHQTSATVIHAVTSYTPPREIETELDVEPATGPDGGG